MADQVVLAVAALETQVQAVLVELVTLALIHQ
jgi:hypothetical protein